MLGWCNFFRCRVYVVLQSSRSFLEAQSPTCRPERRTCRPGRFFLRRCGRWRNHIFHSRWLAPHTPKTTHNPSGLNYVMQRCIALPLLSDEGWKNTRVLVRESFAVSAGFKRCRLANRVIWINIWILMVVKHTGKIKQLWKIVFFISL